MLRLFHVGLEAIDTLFSTAMFTLIYCKIAFLFWKEQKLTKIEAGDVPYF